MTFQALAHTPGPWKACHNGECTCGQVWSMPADCPVFTVLENGTGQVVGLACNEWGDAPDMIYGSVGKEQQTANARLIAAAPDMLALLKELIDIEGPQPGHVMWARKVQAVIAKAAP